MILLYLALLYRVVNGSHESTLGNWAIYFYFVFYFQLFLHIYWVLLLSFQQWSIWVLDILILRNWWVVTNIRLLNKRTSLLLMNLGLIHLWWVCLSNLDVILWLVTYLIVLMEQRCLLSRKNWVRLLRYVLRVNRHHWFWWIAFVWLVLIGWI